MENMKSRSLFRLPLVVLCIFTLRLGASKTASLPLTRTLKGSFLSFDKDDDVSLDEPFMEEDMSEEPAMPPVAEDACIPEENWWRPGNTYNDPSALITSTAMECCDICRVEERCITWSRDRRTGACALKDAVSEAVVDDNYDSGFIEGTDAEDVSPLDGCFREERIAYPRGNVLMRRQTRSVDACCEMCRDNSECFSWHRDGRTRRCVLNRNVPGSVRRGNNFAGATAV